MIGRAGRLNPRYDWFVRQKQITGCSPKHVFIVLHETMALPRYDVANTPLDFSRPQIRPTRALLAKRCTLGVCDFLKVEVGAPLAEIRDLNHLQCRYRGVCKFHIGRICVVIAECDWTVRCKVLESHATHSGHLYHLRRRKSSHHIPISSYLPLRACQ